MSTYSVGVIGVGPIAAMYGKPEDKAPYCHVGGIRHSARVHLSAVADMAADKVAAFEARWKTSLPPYKVYTSGTAMLSEAKPDIVAVCVRGPHHFSVMMDVIAAGPKAIFLEKPPTCSLQEMDEMNAAARDKGIPIVVSYSRHWGPHVLRLAELVKGGLIGEVKHVVGFTGGTFLSFASHTTDLICQFAGYCPTAVYARGTVPDQQVPAGYEVEPALDTLEIEFANGIRGTQIGVNGEHGGFYVDVIGTEGRVRAGIYIPPFACDKAGKVFGDDVLQMPPDASPFQMAYDQIAAYLDGGARPDCCDSDFVAVNEIGFAAIESVRTDKRITLPNVNRTRKVFANG